MLNIRDRIIRYRKNFQKSSSLDMVLTSMGKTRWLDIGCGGNFSKGFYYLDYFANVEIPESLKDRYFSYNLLELSETEYNKMGSFDLVRMQHVFEHFTLEEGAVVLEKCAKLLNTGGILLITVPDLRQYIQYYKRKNFQKPYTFYHWALNRIEKHAPASYFFSIYAYSLLHEQHKWCYDYEGLKYAIEKSGYYSNIKRLRFCNKKASNPFTHNRPYEDLCLISQKKYFS